MNQPWLLLLLPLASAIVIHFLLKQKLATIASLVGTLATAVTLALSIMMVNADVSAHAINWASAGSLNIEIGLKLDQLSKGMMLVVTGIGFLVHVFSLGYMKDDASKARYFGNLSLFMFSMTGIVLASNFVMMFIFWELVGLSSYLLIGHWYQKDSAAEAAKKAFLSNRVGDFGFLIGILMLWGICGSISFDGMSGLEQTTPFLGAAVLLIFCGAVGKSAQLPLHVWLPDAMEGPTPVSALIHAATMVAAGVYMMARLYLSIGAEAVPTCSADIIAWIGGITSLVAALMAIQQDDIKKILAYSTLSQLGYMVMAIGLVAPEAGMFHLFTHAWFKALLFLGSGAVIYACHHEQDIWKMGGLLKKMPITAITFIIGTAALIAVPGTAGFISKEGILHAATHAGKDHFFYLAAGIAALTTFYMLRLVFAVFFGKAREHGAEEAKEVGMTMALPLIVLAVLAVIAGYPMVSQIAPGYTPPTDFHLFHAGPELTASFIALAVGAIAAFVLYFGKNEDPLKKIGLMKVFRNKFYIDEFYAGLVKYFQDIVAAIVHFLDEFVINGLLVGGLTRSAQGIGTIFRRQMQSGNLQNYAFLLGLGVILVIYFTVFF